MISNRTYWYCCEDVSNIENYDKAIADTRHVWICHHRREVQDGFTLWTADELKKIGQYYERPACELILLTRSEHNKVHNTGKSQSDTTKKKIAESHLGKKHTAATKKKLSDAKKGKKLTSEHKQKISAGLCGRYVSEETRLKISNSLLKHKGHKHDG